MATEADCRAALEQLASRLAASGWRRDVERTLSCTVSDLDTTFVGRLWDGRVVGLTTEPSAERAQVRFTVTSDDLVDLAAGRLGVGEALRSRRLSIGASLKDLLALRSLA